MAPTPPLVQGEQLTYRQDGQSARVTVGSAAWFRWLETASTFIYHSERGTFTARLERAGNKRGGTYWRAYRKHAGKLRRAYLGKSGELTLERLQMVAAHLAGQGPAEETAPHSAHEPGAAALQSLGEPQGRKLSALQPAMTRSTPPQKLAPSPSSERDLPTGTTSLLFTDIEGSTRLLQRLGQQYAEVLPAYRHLLRTIFQQHRGYEVDTQGDGFLAVFARGSDAVAAAVAVQRALADYTWPQGVTLRVRMGLHTGELQRASEGYVGLALHQAARIMSDGHGGQVLLSQTTRDLVEHDLPEGVSLRDLGEHRLKDFAHPIHLYQLVIDGLAADFPPLETGEPAPPGDPLLATKLYLPRPRSHLVNRYHLVERLWQGVDLPVTLISAPVGFGKTTLLAQWLAESGTPAAWLSLEPEDNNPVRFLTYVIAALQTIDASLGVTAFALLQAPQPAPPETILALLSNDLARYTGQDFALVLDDYHVISAGAIHQALTFLIDHLSPRMHLIIATRADPPLPLTRLRARGQLVEVRAAELRFSTEEVSTFLQTVMQLQVSPEAAATLWGRTEGWVAGLQLAALSLQGRTDVAEFLDAFSGSHRFVLDYLSDEVLSRQPEAVQSFLLSTAILERLSGPLCDAVTGQQGGQEMLEALERANLFIVALDDERRWYRYHHLFAGVLHRRLQQERPALVPELHRRASAWYLDFGAVREAIHHLLQAGDKERVADVIEAQGLAFGTGNSEHLQSLHGWLNLLPDDLVRARPILCLLHATTFMRTNQFEKAEARMQDAERYLDEHTSVEQARLIKGAAATLRANLFGIQGDLIDTFVFAQQALDLLPESATYIRAIARTILAHAAHGDGDVTAQREQNAAEAVVLIRQTGNAGGTLNNIAALARLRFMQGRLHLAVATYEEARELLTERESLQVLQDSVGYYFGVGDIYREWNRLDEAEALLLRCVEPIRGIFAVAHEVVTQGYGSLARVHMARGDYDKAIEVLDSFAQVAREQHFTPIQIGQGAAIRAQVELARGKLAPAIRWAETSGLSVREELSYPRELSYLVLVRVLIARGRTDPAGSFLKDAMDLLDRILADAEAKARMSSALEVLVLQSLAFDAQGERARALAALERALSIASAEGYVRIFVDEGEPMLTLLRLARKQDTRPDYIATLLAASGEAVREATADIAGSPSLVEPLTEREREVLRLLSEGASNGEMARRLVVSVNTVKKHVFNICGKLGAQNRTQAIAKARSLNLV